MRAPGSLIGGALRGVGVVGVVGLMLVALWARPAGGEPVRFRIATLAPPGSPWMQVLERAAAEIARRTEGRVTIKYFPGGQQGDERDYIRKIKAGQLDGAAVTSIGLSMIEPSIRVLQLPLLFETQDEVDYVVGEMWPYFQHKFAAKGFRLAERGELGWVYLMSRTKVASMADLRASKLCDLGDDQLGTSVFQKLRLQAVPLKIPEIASALATGRIDACLNSPLGAIALQWHGSIRFVSARPLVFAIGATVMALDAAARVAPADRPVIDAIAKAGQKKARALIRRANEDARALLVRKGVQVVDAPPAMVDELTALGVELQRDLIGPVFSQQELDMVLAHRAAYRARRAGAPAAPR